MRENFSDDNSRCTRCGSWGCNLAPAICSRQNRYELFKVFWKEFLDDDTLWQELEREDDSIDEGFPNREGGPWCEAFINGYGCNIDAPAGRPCRFEYMRRAIQRELNDRESIVARREVAKFFLHEYRRLDAESPKEEEIQTAISHINDNDGIQPWITDWLPETQNWSFTDEQIVEVLTHAAQSAYVRGTSSLGDVLRHQDIVVLVNSLVESPSKKLKRNGKTPDFTSPKSWRASQATSL